MGQGQQPQRGIRTLWREFVHLGYVGAGPRRPSEENFQVTPCRGLAPPQASPPRRALEDKRTQENLKTIRFDQVSNFR